MPSGTGWWIFPDGTVLGIWEHLGAVEREPERFGITPEELTQVNGERRPDRRRRILIPLLKQGFIRVRFDRQDRVFEFCAPQGPALDWALHRIGAFLRGEDYGDPSEIYLLNNHAWGGRRLFKGNDLIPDCGKHTPEQSV